VLVVEEEPDTFQANSIVAEMSLMTFGVNRIILETGGHLLAEPGIYERSDGVTIVYCLAQDSFGLIRWTAVYVFENDNIVVAQVNYIGASTFPQVRDRLLAIVLSLDFSPQATGNSPSG
jgi:hypothetical protein